MHIYIYIYILVCIYIYVNGRYTTCGRLHFVQLATILQGLLLLGGVGFDGRPSPPPCPDISIYNLSSGEGKSTTPTVGEKILQSITHVFVSPLRECPSKEKHHMYMYGRPPPPRGALRWFGGGKKNTGGDHSCAMGQLWWVLGCLCGFSRVLLGRLGTRRVICGATCRVTWPFGDPKGH